MEETGLLNKFKKYSTANIFGYVMFIAYPLIFHDYFYDIVTCKFAVFIVVTIFFMIFTLIINRKNKKDDIEEKISLEEKIVFAMFWINAFSFFLSEYKIEALTGAEGRHNGIVTIIAYLIIYLCLSGLKIDKEKILFAVAVGSLLVSVLGILNFLNIDFLGFYDGLSMQYKQFYMSTLGHVNVYSSYFAITLPVVLLLYFQSEKRLWKFIFYFLAIINILGLICSGCESAIIILGTVFVCGLVRQKRILFSLWYVLIVTVVFLNRILVNYNNAQEEKREISRLMKCLSNNKVIFWMIIIGGILVLFDYVQKKHGKEKVVKIFVLSSISILFFGYVFFLVYFTFIDKERNLGKWATFLRINDEFGSYRGYIWRIVVTEFKELSFIKKIVGIGPDALYPFVCEKYGNEMYVVTDAYYDNAHNEFLQYLITTGVAGLGAYLAFLVVKIKTFINNRRVNISKWDEIILCSCICYFVQSVVNINQVVTTPLYVIMLCILNARECERKK